MDNGKYAVLLKDKDQAGISRGEKTIKDELDAKLKKKRITNFEYCDTSSRLIPLHDGVESWKKHFATADIVIEAGPILFIYCLLLLHQTYAIINTRE